MREPPPVLDYQSPVKPVPFAPLRCEMFQLALWITGLQITGLLATGIAALFAEPFVGFGLVIFGVGLCAGLLAALGCCFQLFLPRTDRYSCLLAMLLGFAPTAVIVLWALFS